MAVIRRQHLECHIRASNDRSDIVSGLGGNISQERGWGTQDHQGGIGSRGTENHNRIVVSKGDWEYGWTEGIKASKNISSSKIQKRWHGG